MGIDPGTSVMGYGIIDCQGDNFTLVACDAIKCNKRRSMGERLFFLYRSLCDIIGKYQPVAVAIETPFVADNSRTALAIGKAQAIALLAAASAGLPAFEYSPAAIKYNAASYGNSSKPQVQEMVRLQLDLEPGTLQPDAADALATAICHLRQAHREAITGGAND